MANRATGYRLIGLIALIVLGFTVITSGAYAGVAIGPRLRSISLDGFPPDLYAWAPNSLKLAVSSTNQRSLWVFDLKAGTLTKILEVPNAPVALAWSPDGTVIAVSDGTSIHIVNPATPTDETIPLPSTVSTEGNFGRALAFSPDGSSILLSTGAKNDVWVYRIDVISHQVTAVVKNPINEEKAVRDRYSDQLVIYGGRIYYSTWVRRFLWVRHAGSALATPSSCVVAQLSATGAFQSFRRFDAPVKVLNDNFDRSADIFGCKYVPAEDAILVSKYLPGQDKDAATFILAPNAVYFQSDSLSTGGHEAIGINQLPRQGQVDLYPDAATNLPLLAITFSDLQGNQYASLWNRKTGSLIDSLRTADGASARYPTDIRFSPDGNSLSYKTAQDLQIRSIVNR